MFMQTAIYTRVSTEEQVSEGFSIHDNYDVRRVTRYNDTTYVYRKIDREEFFNPVIEQQVLVRGK